MTKLLKNVRIDTALIRMIKSRRMRWAGHVARMGETNAYRKARRKETTRKTKM
jgi:hypothetical protein